MKPAYMCEEHDCYERWWVIAWGKHLCTRCWQAQYKKLLLARLEDTVIVPRRKRVGI